MDNQNTKNYRKNAKEDQISEHESEYQCSQSSLKKDIEEEKKLQLSDESSSESVSSNSDIHGEGDESNSDVNSDQDSNRIHEVRDVSNLNEKEIRSLIKSFTRQIYLKWRFLKRISKDYQKLLYIGSLRKLEKVEQLIEGLDQVEKNKILDHDFEKIKQLLKEDNTLSAEEMQQKMDSQGIKVSNSTIRRALNAKSIHIESQILNQCFSIRIRRRQE